MPTVSIHLSKIKNEEFSRILYGVFYLLIAMGLVASLGYSPFYDKSKTVIVFSEPSHYALLLFPFLLYAVLFASNKFRLYYILCSLFLALSLQSFTMLIMNMIVLFIILPRRLAIPSIIILICIGVIFLDIEYYTSRMDFSGENKNLSSIVYASGWERAYLSVMDNFPFGIGFQQMGIVGPTGSFMELLEELNAANLNSYDGGSTAPKLIAEFGMLGVLCIYFYLVYFFRLIRWLSVLAPKGALVKDHYQIFLLCCYIAYSADLFLRGAGYFSILMFLFMLCLFSINNLIGKSSYKKVLR